MSDKTLGQIGYEAYYAFTGGKTFDNRDMPTWQQIKEREGGTPRVTAAWEAASEAIKQNASRKPVPETALAEEVKRVPHEWDASGEKCVKCGDKDMYADVSCSETKINAMSGK